MTSSNSVVLSSSSNSVLCIGYNFLPNNGGVQMSKIQVSEGFIADLRNENAPVSEWARKFSQKFNREFDQVYVIESDKEYTDLIQAEGNEGGELSPLTEDGAREYKVEYSTIESYKTYINGIEVIINNPITLLSENDKEIKFNINLYSTLVSTTRDGVPGCETFQDFFYVYVGDIWIMEVKGSGEFHDGILTIWK